MIDESIVVSGLRLTDSGRPGKFGVWRIGVTADGHSRGALLIDPALYAGQALIRLIGRVVAVRNLAAPGILPINDLVTEHGRVWMITDEPATPTIAELLASESGGNADDAFAVAMWTGKTLLALHDAGLTHGTLGPESVVLTSSGVAALVEVSLRPGEIADDIRAWSELLCLLAQRWGDHGLTNAAKLAQHAGLVAALRELNRSTSGQQVSNAQATTRLVPASAPEVTELLAPALPAPEVTELLEPMAAAAVTQPAWPPTETGDDIRLRFGAGVPPELANMWRDGPAPKRAGGRRRWRKVVGIVTACAILGGAGGYLWWYYTHPIHVTGIRVSTASPPNPACDVTVDVVGHVRTNGRSGAIRYQWLRSDGSATPELTQSVPQGVRSVPLHLHWKFVGQGRYVAKATLRILGPGKKVATSEFTYTCK